MLAFSFTNDLIEAGIDEAGRGCIAGPVVAAAVILPKDFYHPLLNDSKQLNENQRNELRPIIEKEALDFTVSFIDNYIIDEINILNATFKAMHDCIDRLQLKPELLLIDGNRFPAYFGISHNCIVKGDAKYANIAAASILAKTYRDEFMFEANQQYPIYDWKTNKGYPTPKHKMVCLESGLSPLHRLSFQIRPPKLRKQ
ncbi:MAG TPA: ribonuclease HII [Edaphocola sp.]|nr:ribonuclease HII [Edaphocola sp.]